MFHGNPTWSFLYRNVIRALRDRFRCIAMDYPGLGLSERPVGYGYTSAEHADVAGKLVDHMQVDRFCRWPRLGGPMSAAVRLRS
jgi:haloalkane dehalogenase